MCDYIPNKKEIAEAIRCLLKRRKLRLSDKCDFEISQQCSWNWSWTGQQKEGEDGLEKLAARLDHRCLVVPMVFVSGISWANKTLCIPGTTCGLSPSLRQLLRSPHDSLHLRAKPHVMLGNDMWHQIKQIQVASPGHVSLRMSNMSKGPFGVLGREIWMTRPFGYRTSLLRVSRLVNWPVVIHPLNHLPQRGRVSCSLVKMSQNHILLYHSTALKCFESMYIICTLPKILCTSKSGLDRTSSDPRKLDWLRCYRMSWHSTSYHMSAHIMLNHTVKYRIVRWWIM
jgi:hypothetical protein